MELTHKKRRMLSLVFFLFACPYFVFAGTECLKNGYTVLTVNGVLTNDDGAKKNKDALQYYFDSIFNNEPLTVDYLLNPSHIAGLGDGLKVIFQKYFSDETIKDTDLLSMLTDASAKVKTQKLLLVAHSQGNFYANSFYNSVADKAGGLPAQAMGVYAVATPSDHVAGNGLYLTSGSDIVISGLASWAPFKKILPPNDTIQEVASDWYLLNPFATHYFSNVYLKYRASTVVSNIQTTLNRLQVDPERREDAPCIDPPKITLSDKVAIVALSFTDGAVEGIAKGVALDAKIISKTAQATYVVGDFTGKQVFRAEVFAVNIAITAVKATLNTAIAAGSKISGAATALIQNLKDQKSNLVVNQGASLLGAVTKNTKTNGADSSLRKNSQGPTLESGALRSDLGNLNPVLPPLATRTVQGESLDKTSASRDIPRLVFVGGRAPMVAAPAQNQVLAYVSEPSGETQEEAPLPSGGSAPALLDTPAIAVPQCVSSLAADGCLLATTTVRFEWTPVTGADHYSLSKNGTLATTTDTVLDIVARDFSDFTLEVSAIGASGQYSATSTQTVSVATIPIAINEIAWMGTVASANDEWIELKNNTGHTIDLSQWVLASADSTPHITLTGVITPREYLVLERTDDTTTSVVAHAVYTGSLVNTGEQLSLLYATTLFDKTPSGVWAAGYNSTTTRKTMERYSSREDGTDSNNWLTWGTNIDFIKNGYDSASSTISGTPGARNSVSYLINKGQDIASDLALTADEGYYIIATSTTVSASSTLTLEPGTAIEFYQASGAPYPELNILGVLDATGASGNPIILESLLGNQTGRIRFVGGTGTSTLAYVWVESLNGIYLINDAHLEVSDAQFVDNYRGLELDDGGIAFVSGKIVHLGKGSTASIENTDFASTTKEAIAAYYGSSVSIASSTITDVFDADAIGIYDSTLVVASTTINRIKYGDGISVYRGSVDVANSTISNILKRNGMYFDTSTSTITNTTIENIAYGSVYIYKGTATIASSTISNVIKGDGIGAYQATVSIASSTIRDILDGGGVYLSDTNGTISNTTIENVSDYGIATYKATTTISNSVIENGGENGIDIYKGATTVTDTTVSGFGGSGISVTNPTEPVAITGGEVTGNTIGIEMDAGSATINPPTSVHDNGSLNENGVWVENNIVVR